MQQSILKKREIENKTAKLYADLFNRMNDGEFYQKTIKYRARIKLDDSWFSGKVCLDAGCGNGIGSFGLVKLNDTKIFAVDISKECLKNAQNHIAGHSNFFTSQASLEAIPFKSGSFDFINCNGVLHHLFDVDLALSEIYRVLKPGGFMFIGVYGRGGLLNEYKIKIYRFFSRFFPYLLLRDLLWSKDRNELLDNICVPIRRSFSDSEMRDKLSHFGLSAIERYCEGFYRQPKNFWEKISIGPNGMYLHFLAKK